MSSKSEGVLRYRHKFRNEMTAEINELNEMQKNLPLLTEEEWNKAVRHFKSCAMCPSESIDARLMLIPAKDGGKYNRGNVLPVCNKCATVRSISNWPSTMMAKQHGDGHYTRDPHAKQRLRDAVAYLKQEASHD